MKTTVKIILTTILVSLLAELCLASFHSTYTFYYNDREVTIEGDYLDQDQAQIIADYIVYGIIPSESLGSGDSINTPLLCILFGHSTETYAAMETVHNVYTTSPKCVVNIYRIEYCTRESCDYIQKTLTSSYRTAQCHG